jgi:DUF4097 and DUF4098 domain-containing protein YvlB
MKKLALFTSLALLLFVASAFSQELKGTSGNFTAKIEKSYDVSPGGNLTVKKVVGDFTIKGWSKNVVEITQSIKIKSYTRGEAEEVYRRVLASYDASGSKVRIEGDYNGNRIRNDFIINVPEKFNVEVGTSGGNINLSAVEGEIGISTSGGDIDVMDTAGRVKANTSGGDLKFSSVSGPVKASTSGGDIDLVDIFGEGTFSTSGGDITLRNATNRVRVSTSGGSINVASVSAELNANTSGGNIDIRDISGDCSVSTSGGDIDLNDIKGSLKANTSGGDISGSNFDKKIHVNTSGGDINLNNLKAAVSGNTSGGDVTVIVTTTDFSQDHSVDLRTSGGTIKLTIPEELPATINAQIRTSRKNYERKRYDIYSDFPLTKTKPEDYGKVIIKSEGDINGGGDMVRLETSGGDIHIKKGK